MRKRLLLFLALAVCLAVAFAVFLVLSEPGRRINKANWAKIKDGMTLQQVEALIGKPDDPTFPAFEVTTNVPPIYWASKIREPKQAFKWEGNNGVIEVYLDAEGKAAASLFLALPNRESIFDRIRRVLRLP